MEEIPSNIISILLLICIQLWGYMHYDHINDAGNDVNGVENILE